MTEECIICEEALIKIGTGYWCGNRHCDVGLPKHYKIGSEGLFGLKKPQALSAKGWTNWTKMAKEQRPIRYYLSDTLAGEINHLRYKLVGNPLTWIRHRTYNRYHRIDTGLAPGWNDVTEKMLHVNFNMLKNYIEREKASHMLYNEGVVSTKKWHQVGPFDNWSDPALGLKHLDWEMTLGGGKSHQAKAAKEQFELYDWWINIRPNRMDPMDVSGLTAWYDEQDDSLDMMELLALRETEGSKRQEAWKVMNTVHEQVDSGYIKEDEDNLIRLMKIRYSLWT